MEDGQVLNHIDELAKEEHRLYSGENLSEGAIKRLHKITAELDQCWDLLRQRRGLRDAHANPDVAKVRSENMIENQK